MGTGEPLAEKAITRMTEFPWTVMVPVPGTTLYPEGAITRNE